MYNCSIELALKRYFSTGYLDLDVLKLKSKDLESISGELLYREVLLTTNIKKLKNKLTEVDRFISIGLNCKFPEEVEVEDLKNTIYRDELFESYVDFLYGTYRVSYNNVIQGFITKYWVQSGLVCSFPNGFTDKEVQRPKILNLLDSPEEALEFKNILSENELRYILVEICNKSSSTNSHNTPKYFL